MKTACVLVFVLSIMFAGAVQADMQLVDLGYGDNGGLAFVVGGSPYHPPYCELWDFEFDLYLQVLTGETVRQGDGDVEVTDLGMTHEQNHLFRIKGRSCSPFYIDPEWGGEDS